MNTKRTVWLLFVVSLAGTVFGHIISNSRTFGICSITKPSCMELADYVGDPLLWGMPALAAIFFFLLFIPKAFSAWWKFAIWYVPLAAVLLAVYNPNPGDWAAPPREWIILAVSGIYLVVSLTIIAIAALRKQR